jgi:hypothetical protein
MWDTCGLGDGADEHGRDGHEDAASRRHVRQHLGAARRLAAQHTLEVHLHHTEQKKQRSSGVVLSGVPSMSLHSVSIDVCS